MSFSVNNLDRDNGIPVSSKLVDAMDPSHISTILEELVIPTSRGEGGRFVSASDGYANKLMNSYSQGASGIPISV